MGGALSRESEVKNIAEASEVKEPEASASDVSCPAVARNRGPVYNVYNQVIQPDACPVPGNLRTGGGLLDARNNMPATPNQQPSPGQLKPLSTLRLQSSIPKGGTEATWQYPSSQMFFNALKRKNKADDVTEDDMDAVVFAHNSMNELTWARVLMWESLHKEECSDPRLRRFMGRPDDLSPLARLHSWFGSQLPFDRHDWYVDRCGKEVRYVIDFYFHEEKAGTPEAFSIRARPAVDSAEAIVDRLKMRIYTTFAKYGLPCPISGHPSSTQFSERRPETEGQQSHSAM